MYFLLIYNKQHMQRIPNVGHRLATKPGLYVKNRVSGCLSGGSNSGGGPEKIHSFTHSFVQSSQMIPMQRICESSVSSHRLSISKTDLTLRLARKDWHSNKGANLTNTLEILSLNLAEQGYRSSLNSAFPSTKQAHWEPFIKTKWENALGTGPRIW